jgi:uncharacterized protein YbjT (DUF2867 family)
MRVLATCATGSIGALLVPALLEAGHDVSVLTRNAKNVRGFGINVEAVEGDWTDPETLRDALEGRDALILIGNGEMELFGNLFAVEAARASDTVRHVVYIGGQNPEGLYEPPTTAPKLVTEKALRDSGLPTTVIRPSTFMQNDIPLRDAIREGIYPAPFGDVGVARVDLIDVAAAVIVVLGNVEHFGKTYTLCGPENLTGPQIAETWARALERDVVYLPLELDQFEQLIRSQMSIPMAHSIRMQFERYQAGALLATPEDVDQVSLLLGRRPRAFADFTGDVARSWELESI